MNSTEFDAVDNIKVHKHSTNMKNVRFVLLQTETETAAGKSPFQHVYMLTGGYSKITHQHLFLFIMLGNSCKRWLLN